MDKYLTQEYENPGYPVSVNFIENKKENGAQGYWAIRRDDTEVIIVNNGEVNLSWKNGVYKIHAGQGVLIESGTRVRITTSQKEDTAFYSVVFAPRFVMDKELDDSIRLRYSLPFEADNKYSVILLDESNLSDEAAIDKINNIIAVNLTKKRGYELLTKGYLSMLMAQMLEYCAGENVSFSGRNVPSQDELRVRSAINFMQENYADIITLEDIADRIHVSRNECCRCFKRVTMTTPVEFLIRLRVFEAAKVIYKNPLSVDTFSELAFKTGFNNTSYFNKMFRRYIGCTPKEYTKMIKSDTESAKKIYDSLQESVTGII